MEIKGEKVEVVPFARDDKGQKLEPEEAPARRLLDVSQRITLSGPDGTTQSTVALPMSISLEMPAHELARGMSQPCFSCRHFDAKAWGEYRRAKLATPEGRAEMISMGEGLIENGAADPEDVEAVLDTMGICRVLTEARRDAVTVHPVSTCPDTLPNSVEPFPRSYEPRSSDDARQSTATFDSIMRSAQGRR